MDFLMLMLAAVLGIYDIIHATIWRADTLLRFFWIRLRFFLSPIGSVFPSALHGHCCTIAQSMHVLLRRD